MKCQDHIIKYEIVLFYFTICNPFFVCSQFSVEPFKNPVKRLYLFKNQRSYVFAKDNFQVSLLALCTRLFHDLHILLRNQITTKWSTGIQVCFFWRSFNIKCIISTYLNVGSFFHKLLKLQEILFFGC